MGHDLFRCGDLEAVIGDNAAVGQHRPGYNGLWSLKHATADRSLFVPSVAGLNFEHIFDGATVPNEGGFFEPRKAPMTFRRLSEHEAELYQPPTPTFHLESWTRFRLVAPHYVDFEFRAIPHQHAFRLGYIGLFWASYMAAPEDRSMYFLGSRDGEPASWMQFCPQGSGIKNTVRHRDDELELDVAPGFPQGMLRDFSPMRFDLPFFYGLFDQHLFLVMFDRAEHIRLAQYPTGGGFTPERQSGNPAWDFQFLIPRYKVHEEYRLRARAVLRERCSRSEVLAEYHLWSGLP